MSEPEVGQVGGQHQLRSAAHARRRGPRLACTVLLLGSALAALVAGSASAAFPGDNGRIAFQSSRSGIPQIFSMSSDGTNETPLTSSAFGNRQPSYSPNGRKIVFTSHRDTPDNDPGPGEIYIMNPDGSDQTRLTNNDFADTEPAFSANGRMIVFTSNRTGRPALYSMNLDGTAQTRLTTNPDGRDDNNATPSPDGSRTLFEASLQVSTDIFALEANGSRVNLTKTPGNKESVTPSWAPDGRTIAFASSRNDVLKQIWVMDANGGNMVNLTPGADESSDPAFSPDGRKIAFRRESSDPVGAAIFTMDRDASNPTQITGFRESSRDVAPDWGPRPRPTATADVLHGTSSGNRICGRGGGDTVYGLGGNDTLFGDRCDAPQLASVPGRAAAPPGGDKLLGGRGNDKLYAGGRGDRLNGGPGRDLLHGGAGPDRFFARDGQRDTIMCGFGLDVVRADAKDRLIDCGRL
jgi:Tol biopolymer transport system component